jgi:hypothetical protein
MHPYRRKNITAKGNLFQEREGILKAMIIYWIYKIDMLKSEKGIHLES